jgi:hypothetical protein
VTGAGFTDAAGNLGVNGQDTVAIDRVNPSLVSLVIESAEAGATTNIGSGTVAYTATFSEAVSGLVAGDFAITGGTVTAVQAVSTSGPSVAWTVTVQPTANSVTPLALSFKGDTAGAVVDAVGNARVGGANDAAASQAVDTIAPTLAATPVLRDVVVGDVVVRQEIEIRLSEPLALANPTALTSQFSVIAGGYNVAVASVALSPTHSDRVILTLSDVITKGLGVQLRYNNLSVDAERASATEVAVQDVAGNDLATTGISPMRPTNSSNVDATFSGITQTRVFSEGKLGGSGNDTLSFTASRGTEFLLGGAGTGDTVAVSTAGSANGWLIGASSSITDPALAGFVRTAMGSAPVFSFVNPSAGFATAYVQAETITFGNGSIAANSTGTTFTVGADGVLQIGGSRAQNLSIDTELVGSSSSLRIGSGAGNDIITDSADWTGRSDTVVYKAASLGLTSTDAAVNPLANVNALLSNLTQVVKQTTSGATLVDNSITVSLPGQTNTVVDTLVGVERLRFVTADSQQVDVALVGQQQVTEAGDTRGLNGYESVAAAAADAASTQVLMVFDPTLRALDPSSLVMELDGRFSTVGGNTALRLPGSNTPVEVNGLQQVIFASKDAADPVRVLVVGADGFATIDQAMALAEGGDVIYLADNALTTPTTYVVQKEGMIFMGNSSMVNGQPQGANLLTLELGYSDVPVAAGNDQQVRSLTLLGDANISVRGNDLSNVIVGNRGSNSIVAGGGNDVVSTGGGSDMVYGGEGNDLLVADKGVVGEQVGLFGEAGQDLLVVATSSAPTTATGARVVMNGGTDGDTFKVGSLASDNGAVRVDAIINDLSSRSGDDLDLSLVLKSAQSVTYAELSKTYSSGTLQLNFGGLQVVSFDRDELTGSQDKTVELLGSLRVEMTTQTNVATAFVNPGETTHPTSPQALSPLTLEDRSVAADVSTALTAALSSAAEANKLLPLFEHNPLT